MTNGQMTETQVLEYLKHIPQKTTEQTIAEMRKEFPKEHLQAVRYYYKNYAEIVTESAKINGKELCDKFKETPEWKNGKTNCGGYATCCIWLGFCGGMSGWIIALIVLLILGTCAAGAAAFYFFYWRRKNGGQEAKEEKEEETTDGTVMEVSIENY